MTTSSICGHASERLDDVVIQRPARQRAVVLALDPLAVVAHRDERDDARVRHASSASSSTARAGAASMPATLERQADERPASRGHRLQVEPFEDQHVPAPSRISWTSGGSVEALDREVVDADQADARGRPPSCARVRASAPT